MIRRAISSCEPACRRARRQQASGPKLIAGFGFDELDRDAHALFHAAGAAGYDAANTKFFCDLANIGAGAIGNDDATPRSRRNPARAPAER